MSTLDQVKENLDSAGKSSIELLSEQELDLVKQVKDTYESMVLIPCTSCNYCIPCPEDVDIPRILRIYNDGIMFEKVKEAGKDYILWVPAGAKADNCVVCRECEEKCPQHIPISDWMSKIHQEYTS